jgi:hypothetical protein
MERSGELPDLPDFFRSPFFEVSDSFGFPGFDEFFDALQAVENGIDVPFTPRRFEIPKNGRIRETPMRRG